MAVELGLEGEGENPSGQQVRGIRKRGQHEQTHHEKERHDGGDLSSLMRPESQVQGRSPLLTSISLVHHHGNDLLPPADLLRLTLHTALSKIPVQPYHHSA